MSNHRDLQVWQRACLFASRVDHETRQLARGHGELGGQLRRAALSIPTNLAEGSSKGRDPEFLRSIHIAVGSAAECDSLLAHAELVGALHPGMLHELVEELTVIRKMLFRPRGALQARAVTRQRAMLSLSMRYTDVFLNAPAVVHWLEEHRCGDVSYVLSAPPTRANGRARSAP